MNIIYIFIADVSEKKPGCVNLSFPLMLQQLATHSAVFR